MGLLQSGACPVASYMFVPSAWIAVFLEAGGVPYCLLMEIYRTLSVNKKLVNHNNTCEVAPVNRQPATNAEATLKTGSQTFQWGKPAPPVDWSGLPSRQVIFLLFVGRPVKPKTFNGKRFLVRKSER